MVLAVPPLMNNFAWSVSDISGTRPAASMGVSVTPAQNAKGSYAQVLSATARDSYLMMININANNAATDGRSTLIDIGVDPAGGTSYTVLIPDLLGSCAGFRDIGGGISYTFPLWVRAGSSIGARASVSHATVGTLRVSMTLFGSPRDMRMVKAGTYVTSFGITGASSTGTAVTSGTTSEGAWTQLGSTTTREHWFWQAGMSITDDTMNALSYHFDLGIGDGTNKKVVIEDVNSHTTAAEAMNYCSPGGYYHSKIGDGVYGRMQCSGTADASPAMAAWGVGG